MKNKIKDSNTSCSDAQRSTRSVKAKPALVPLKGGSEAQLSKSHSHLQASPRKTFKKVYEQKHLVRNTKDQYSAVCDKVWQKSHQRLKIQLDGGMSKPAVPEAKLPLGDLITAKTAFGKATTFDFFDLYAVKKTPSSNNRYMLLGSGTMLPLGSAASLLSYTPSCSDEDKDAKDPNTLRSNAQHSKASPKIKDFQVSGSLTSSIVVK